jgi:hypothetical protein
MSETRGLFRNDIDRVEEIARLALTRPAAGGPPTGAAGGNLTGTYPNPTVAQLFNATVPMAGALTTGNVLQVTGASALGYAPVNLAGGNASVTGVLPLANEASPSGSGFPHVTGGVYDAAARAVNLATADVTGVLPLANEASPSGSGFPHVTGGAYDAAARAVNLATADVTGTLPSGAIEPFTPAQSIVPTTDNSINLGSSAKRFANVSSAVGTFGGANPAASGQLRVPNATVAVAARNAANGADITVVGTDASNDVLVGDGTNTAQVIVDGASKSALVVQSAGVTQWQIGTRSDNTGVTAIYGSVTPSSTNYALRSDGSFTILNVASGGTVSINVAGVAVITLTGTGIGFFGSSAAAKPTVSGSKGGNAALASLMTALAALGLVTDSTT